MSKQSKGKQGTDRQFPPDKGRKTDRQFPPDKGRKTDRQFPPDKGGKGGYIPYNKTLTEKARKIVKIQLRQNRNYGMKFCKAND